MRFVGSTLQFSLFFSAFCILGQVLPHLVVSIFSLVASAFLCFCATLWIIELFQDFFFKSEVDKKNKAVVITGCDTGFGNSFARLLHDRGFHVYACCYDKDSDGATSLLETCSSRLKVVQMDVTKDDSVEAAVKFVESSLGNTRLWAVINNAGVLKGFHSELSSMKDYEDCLQVNTLGVIRVTKSFLPLVRRWKGRVINICSISGRFRCPLLAAYTTSKTACIAFTEILKEEMREFGVRVISIEPEFFKTQMCSEKYLRNVMEQSMSQISEKIKAEYGEKYIQKAEDLYLSVFLSCSDNIKLVTDAVEAAVCLENPADVYKPARSILFKIFFMVGERVAPLFIELFAMVVKYIYGIPPPKTGVNYLKRLIKM